MCRGSTTYRSRNSVSVAERRARLASCRRERRAQVGGVVHAVHALAAAARRRLDQHGEPDVACRVDQVVVRQTRAVHSGDDRDARGLDGLLGRDLVAHRLDRRRGRADEHDPRVGAGARELGVLGQEAVPGVDGLRTDRPCGRQHGGDVEVAGRRRGRTDPHSDVRGRDVPGTHVGVAVDDRGADAHAPQRAQHPDRDLAAVGHQDRREHARPTSGRRRSPAPPARRPRRRPGPGPARRGSASGR